MVYSFNDIRCKEIINVRNGCRIGFPDDIEFDSCTAKICRLVVFGRAKFFGLFGREEDICINGAILRSSARIRYWFPVMHRQYRQEKGKAIWKFVKINSRLFIEKITECDIIFK